MEWSIVALFLAMGERTGQDFPVRSCVRKYTCLSFRPMPFSSKRSRGRIFNIAGQLPGGLIVCGRRPRNITNYNTPGSDGQILRHARGQGNVHFPCSADHEQDWQPYPVDPYSAICDDHTYIHTYCTSVSYCFPSKYI